MNWVVVCKFCNKIFGDTTRAVEHLLSECGIEGNKEEYWRSIVKLAFENVINDIAEDKLSIEDANIDEIRAVILLASIGLIKIPDLNLSPEELQLLILTYCPELALYALKYVELIEIEDGTVRLKKEKDMETKKR